METVKTLTGDDSQRDVFWFFAHIAKNLVDVIDFYKNNIEATLFADLGLRTKNTTLGEKALHVFEGFNAEDVVANKANLKDHIASIARELERIAKASIPGIALPVATEAYAIALTATMFRLSQARKWLVGKKITDEKIDEFFEKYEKLFVFYGLARACYDADYSIVTFDYGSKDDIAFNIMYGILFGAVVDKDKNFDIMSRLGPTNSGDEAQLTCDALVNWVNFNVDKYKVQDLMSQILAPGSVVPS